MLKIETKLARVFTTLAESGKSTDNVAKGILDIVKEAGVKDAPSFDPLVRAAYAANGWNPRPGRPTEETAKLEMVPATVRTYVTAVRRALRRGINVAKLETFYELRKAIRKTKVRDTAPAVPKAVQEKFAGVDLETVNDVNGSLIHDVGAIYANLPKQHQSMFERQLSALVAKYLPLARGLRSVNPDEKAAVG
jgi:hypothetical protein